MLTLQPQRAIDLKDSVRRFLPHLALVFGILALGMSAIFVKWANAPGAVSGFYRMSFAAVILALPFGAHIRRRGRPSTRHLLFAVLGGVFFALDLAAWNTALLITSAASATFLGCTSPLWVGIGTLVLFKRKLHREFWGGTLLAMIGATIIVGRDFMVHSALGMGDLLGLVAGVFYGLFFLAAERAREKLSSLAALWISIVSSTMVLCVLSLALGQAFTGYPIQTYANLGALALVVQVAGWFAINYALGHLPASLVSSTLLAQPVLTAILAVPFLGQPLGASQAAGGAIALAGILIVHRSK
jgi:drug/metabolite transporter (DMT)-like permease